MIALIAKLLAALNANRRPGEVGAAFACGIMLALIPGGNLLWYALLLLFILYKLHIGTLLLTVIIGKLAAGLADPLLDAAGLWILEQPALQPFFIAAANAPLLPFTRFNNSLVAGGFAVGLLLWLPLFFLASAGVRGYRNRIRERIARSKLVRSIERIPWMSKLIKAVRRSTALYEGWYGS